MTAGFPPAARLHGAQPFTAKTAGAEKFMQ